jgi:hypothetical protein
MSKKPQNSSNDLLKTVGGIAAILIIFVVILRAALDPLYQEVGQLEARQNQTSQMNAGGSTQQSDNGGGGGNEGGGENVNVNIGGLGGLFNWALGWAWGGPGWYSGPDYGWWGANVWNGWSNRWNGGGWNGNNNRVWDGTVNENNTRNFNDAHSNQDIRNDGGRDSRREDQNGGREFRNDGGRNQESHGGGHEGGGGSHQGGGDHGRR